MSKRFWTRMTIVLSVAGLLTLFGFYQVYRLADRIYQLTPAPNIQQLHARQQAAQSAEEQPPRLSLYEQAKRLAEAEERAQKAKQAQTFLLLGVDSRRGERARSDSILLAAVPNGGGNVRLMSIPRDTYTHVPGHGYTKINHAMSYGGVSLMKSTVEEFLNVPVDHVLTVDFDGFRKVVDTSFMIAFMFPPGVNPADVEKYMNGMKRAQMDLDFEPEKYKHHYLKEIPERYQAQVDVRRFGPSERVVFLPYSETVYARTQAWLQERGLFEVKPPVNYTGSVAA